MTSLLLAQITKSAYKALNFVYHTKQNIDLPDGWDVENVFWGKDFDAMRPFGILVSNGDTAVFAFRGTETWSEWFEDAEIALVDYPGSIGKVHCGFYRLFNSLVDKHQMPFTAIADGFKEVFYTGHSLGAALATFGALKANSARLVTFGSPKVGDKDFCNQAYLTLSVSLRYVSKYDPVPLLPLLSMSMTYDHFVNERTLQDKQNSILTPANNHFLDRYIQLLESQ